MSVNNGYRVLVVDDEDSIRFILKELLGREGCQVEEARDGVQAIEMARREGYDLYLLDMKMPRKDGLTTLREIRGLYPAALAVMITAYGSEQHALDALKAGAYDYFKKPFNIDELRTVLMRVLEKQNLLRKINRLQQQVGVGRNGNGMIGDGPAMNKVAEMIDRVAEHDVTVLITGESGTGKELVAEALHQRSGRAKGPLVKVNCAAIPEPLLESELFGHEKGAFTGAIHAKPGKFEVADGGTLLLDEIGEMPLSLQSKLLRVLQEQKIERIGSTSPRTVDLRVLTATHRDLWAMVEEGTFREDLYFRINVVPIHLPPLRERKEDLPALVQYFIGLFNARFGKRIEGVTPEAMTHLEAYDWPGNIRELENTLQRAVVMAIRGVIEPDALPAIVAGTNGGGNRANAIVSGGNGAEGAASQPMDFNVTMHEWVETLIVEAERSAIREALSRTDGRRQETADLLGISRKSLHNKMQKYALFES